MSDLSAPNGLPSPPSPSPSIIVPTSTSPHPPSPSTTTAEDSSSKKDISSSLKNAKSKPSSASTAKPKSSKHPRSPSPSPPPIPRPPLQTIRLEITLGGPDNYEVDLAVLAKNSGQRQPTPPPVKREISDSEGEEDQSKDKEKKKKKKHVAVEYYDTSDPFIDDSELPMDERTFFAQTKQQGFYVSSGEVALLKDKSTPKKPKSKKLSFIGPPARISSNGTVPHSYDGSRDSPIPVTSDNDDERKRKLSEEHSEGQQKKRKTELRAFHPELEAAIEDLKAEIAKESWTKGKFPPSLKPLLAQVALKAVVLGEYDENFFNFMPKLFPYNKFTMSKLIKRTIWKDHMTILTDRQTELLDELAVLTKEGFSKAQEEWEKSVVAWEKKRDKVKAAEAEAEAGSLSGDGGAAPTPMAVDDAPGSGNEQDPASKANNSSAKEKEGHPPAKKYRMTEQLKSIIWQLVCLSNECCRIENERNSLEGTGQTVSEQGVRKVLYQKILHAFPEGWISSGQISREVSSMKKKFERESLAEAAD